jgi:hypothetical protein
LDDFFFHCLYIGAYYSFVFLALHFNLMYSHAMTILLLLRIVRQSRPGNGHVRCDSDQHMSPRNAASRRLLSVLSVSADSGRKKHGAEDKSLTFVRKRKDCLV